jgi:lipopolysaccharide heptosyltransferase I
MRILILKLSSIGDVVHTLPAAASLRHALPEAFITWVVERRASELLKDSSVINQLIEVDTRAWRREPFSATTLEEIRSALSLIRGSDGGSARRTDIAIDFQGLLKSGLVALASGAMLRVGFETADLREKASRIFLNRQVATAVRSHVIEKNLALAHAVIGDVAGEQIAISETNRPYEFPIAVSAADEQYLEETIIDPTSRFAIINPGGGWPTKLWPAGAYGELADWLWEKRGLNSFVTYGPGEEGLAAEVAKSSRTGAASPFACTIKQFVALTRRAELFVGSDTGPLHIAAACGTAIVGLYGPTSPNRNGPFRRVDVIAERDLWCRADCHRRSCWHWECMKIAPSEVKRAISARLENTIQLKGPVAEYRPNGSTL